MKLPGKLSIPTGFEESKLNGHDNRNATDIPRGIRRIGFRNPCQGSFEVALSCKISTTEHIVLSRYECFDFMNE